jgi:hypothetical protein
MTANLRFDSLNLIYNFIKQNDLNRRSKIGPEQLQHPAVTVENPFPQNWELDFLLLQQDAITDQDRPI